MDFIKKHKISLLIGVSCFVIGYVSGGIMEARSMQKELANNILSQVAGQQSRMRESRESSERQFAEAGQKKTERNVEVLTSEVSDVQKRTRTLEANFDDLKSRFERVQKKQQVLFEEHLKKQETGSIFTKPLIGN